MNDDQRCDVCGRTILAGERVRTYMSPKEGRRLVCDLCRGSAERLGWVDPAARGSDVGRRPGAEPAESSLGRPQRAVERFNRSPTARTVAGLMRTLGEPSVSVGAAAGSPSEVRITVAWELGWYQWGIDLADDRRAVFQIGKGESIEQLDGPARQWNASAGADGKLRVGAPAGHPRDGEPAR